MSSEEKRGSGLGLPLPFLLTGFVGFALTAWLLVYPSSVLGQNSEASMARAAVAGEVAHMQRMRTLFPDTHTGAQATPPVISPFQIDPDPTGAIATIDGSGPTITANSPFFQSLGQTAELASLVTSPRMDGRSARNTLKSALKPIPTTRSFGW